MRLLECNRSVRDGGSIEFFLEENGFDKIMFVVIILYGKLTFISNKFCCSLIAGSELIIGSRAKSLIK